MKLFFKLLRAKVSDLAQNINHLIRKTNNASQNYGHNRDAIEQLFCLFQVIFKDIEIIDDDAGIEVQQFELVAKRTGETNAKTEKI